MLVDAEYWLHRSPSEPWSGFKIQKMSSCWTSLSHSLLSARNECLFILDLLFFIMSDWINLEYACSFFFFYNVLAKCLSRLMGSDDLSTVSWLVKNFTFRIRSCSSTTPSSLPIAWAIRFPATKLPTSIEAGPTSTEETKSVSVQIIWSHQHDFRES